LQSGKDAGDKNNQISERRSNERGFGSHTNTQWRLVFAGGPSLGLAQTELPSEIESSMITRPTKPDYYQSISRESLSSPFYPLPRNHGGPSKPSMWDEAAHSYIIALLDSGRSDAARRIELQGERSIA